MKVVIKPITDIKPYDKNPRRNEQAVTPVANSIKEFGWQQPLVIDKKGVIIAGHTRYLAAQQLGLTEVPVVVADLTERQAKAYRLADNKTGELAAWDFPLLDLELTDIGLDFDLSQFGFDLDFVASTSETQFYEDEKTYNEWYDNHGDSKREDGNDEYNAFVEKFEPKKTTDDCYTPPCVYDAIADWVAAEYGLDRNNFVRPFYPGGNYQGEIYKDTDIVVDNPPFSILSEIINWYCAHNIKFFLFAPTLTLFTAVGEDIEYIPCGISIIYENGARVNTSFINNIGSNRIYCSPELYQAVKTANTPGEIDELPRYVYPPEVIQAARIYQLAKGGVKYVVPKDQCVYVANLDAMRERKAEAFGGLFLLSEKAAAEKAAAEKAAAEIAAAKAELFGDYTDDSGAIVWQLSEREKNIIKSLRKDTQ